MVDGTAVVSLAAELESWTTIADVVSGELVVEEAADGPSLVESIELDATTFGLEDAEVGVAEAAK